ncbi:tyrosine-type recombinase/integrase [Desulfovibrio sp.]|uniref:tyrosine-type recombinase/integrase n=1 Tax=Desulfovibrio sp. TaxID=885 RepID=UPI003D120F50
MAIIAYMKTGKKAYRAKFKHQNRQFTQAGFTTQAEARAWIVEEKKRLKKEAEAPQSLSPQSVMFSEACARHLADSRSRQQPGTFDEKRRHTKKFAAWLGGDIPVSQITPSLAQDFIAHIQLLTTNKTANRFIRTLKTVWNWTSRRESLGPNPFNAVEPYPEESPRRYVPPTEDVVAVLALAEQWERDYLHILVKTGARPGEIRTLTWDDVDFSRCSVTLWTRKRKGGERQPRIINMSEQLLDLLKRRFKERKSEVWVFINEETGSPFTRQSRPIKYLMERLCERANAGRKKCDPEAEAIKPFTFYALRHFVATRLRDSGKANRYEIQHILGHMHSDTTDRYLRSLAPDVKEAIQSLDSVIDLDKITADEEKQPAKITRFSRA